MSKKIYLGLGAVVVILMIIGFVVVGKSEPGNLFYSLKTSATESNITAIDTDSLEAAGKQFETRLAEAQRLVVDRNTATTTAEALQAQLVVQLANLETQVTNPEVDVVKALALVVQVESILDAIDRLTQTEIADGAQRDFDKLTETAVDLRLVLRDRLVTAGRDPVTTYLEHQVAAMTTLLQEPVPVERDVSAMGELVVKANQALNDGNLRQAVAFTNQAVKVVNERQYLQLPKL